MRTNAPENRGLGLTYASDHDLAELAALFVAELPERVAKLHDVCRRAEWERVGGSARQLASAAGSFGLVELRPLALRLEDAARNREPEAEVMRCLDELERLCQA